MPDGDIINVKLSGQYRKSYRMICEDKLDDTECAKVALHALKKQIQGAGNQTIDLVKALSTRLDQNSVLISNNTQELKKILNKVLRESRVSPRISGLISNSFNGLIHDLKYGKVSSKNFNHELINRYILETYKSSFIGKINATSKHYLDTSPEKIKQKLKQIEPKIHRTITLWADKLSSGDTVEKLRQLPLKRKKVNLEENLL